MDSGRVGVIRCQMFQYGSWKGGCDKVPDVRGTCLRSRIYRLTPVSELFAVTSML